LAILFKDYTTALVEKSFALGQKYASPTSWRGRGDPFSSGRRLELRGIRVSACRGVELSGIPSALGYYMLPGNSGIA